MGACCSQSGDTHTVQDESIAEVVTGAKLFSPEAGVLSPDAVLALLSKVPLFRRLPLDSHNALATAFTKVAFAVNGILYKQGDSGEEFFVIMSGKVSVLVDDVKVTSLSEGDYLGENSLLRNETRAATAMAETEVIALKLDRATFRSTGLFSKVSFAPKRAVGGGIERETVTKLPTVKTADDWKVMMNALKSNEYLKLIANLDESMINALIDIAWEEVVENGVDIITQGSTEADYFYIVKAGKFEVMIDKDAAAGVRSADQAVKKIQTANFAESVGVVGPGGSFGELALHYFTPRSATVKAKAKSVVWVIDRQNFKLILANAADNSETYVKYLDRSDVFDALLPDERIEVARNLNEKLFEKGETIVEQGDRGESFHILIQGEVSVTKDGAEIKRLTCTSQTVEIFGELALLGRNDGDRSATVTVVSPTVKTLYMDKLSFEMLLMPLEEIQARGKQGRTSVKKKVFRSKSFAERPRSEREHIKRADLTTLGLLGFGGFGVVELVEHNTTKEMFAMKGLNKGFVVMSGNHASVMAEKSIQMMCDSPFVVMLYETYNSYETCYFLLELSSGGDVNRVFRKNEFWGSTKHSQYYIAGAVFGLEHLHERKIIWRDLKPENMLITETGQVKMTDFGVSKVSVGKTFTTCGTPDYVAPEVVDSVGHTHAADWWTLGITVFELMTGRTPFESANPARTFKRIKQGMEKIAFPPEIQGDIEHLIKGLCRKDPSERLPSRKGGSDNIKNHKWYKGTDFDWDSMFVGTLTPPFIPVVRKGKDAVNDCSQEDMPAVLKYSDYDDGSGWDAEFATSE